jgi:hypothetical protein
MIIVHQDVDTDGKEDSGNDVDMKDEEEDDTTSFSGSDTTNEDVDKIQAKLDKKQGIKSQRTLPEKKPSVSSYIS